MNMKKFALIFILAAIYFQLTSTCADASFGVSPADLSLDYLSPGMTVEQEFLISRTDLNQEADINIETDIQGANDWVKINPGNALTIPQGKQTETMTAIISVPEDAEYKKYEGYLTLKIAPGGKTAGVSIVEGVGIAVNLTVTKSVITNLLIRKMEIPALTIGNPIRLLLATENQGNQEASPEKAEIIVKDLTGKELLRSEDTTFEKIEPGRKKELAAEFENGLSRGEYYADVSIYFQGKPIKEDKLVFSVEEKVETPKEPTVVLGSENLWIPLFKFVLLSTLPVTCIWVIIRRKYTFK
jgi:hypothetical protein